MKISLLNNLPYKLAALIIAVAVFQMVQTLEQPQLRRTFDVTLEYLNRPDDLAVTEGPTTIRVDVSSLSGEFVNVDPEDVKAYVDLSDAQPGKSTFDVRLSYSERIRKLANLEPRPEQVEVVLERNILKVLDVTAQFVGQKEGFKMDKWSIDPPQVRIYGAEGLVNTANEARITIDLSKLEPGGAYEQPVEVLSKDNRPIGRLTLDPPRVTFRASLAALAPNKVLLVTPVWVGVPKFGFRVERYSLEPNQIRFIGDAEILAELSTVETEPIDISNLDADKLIQVNVKVPAGLRADGNTNVRVFIKIVKDNSQND